MTQLLELPGQELGPGVSHGGSNARVCSPDTLIAPWQGASVQLQRLVGISVSVVLTFSSGSRILCWWAVSVGSFLVHQQPEGGCYVVWTEISWN